MFRIKKANFKLKNLPELDLHSALGNLCLLIEALMLMACLEWVVVVYLDLHDVSQEQDSCADLHVEDVLRNK